MDIPASLEAQLQARSRATGESVEALVAQFLRQGLASAGECKSLFVSAPVNALIEGIYQENTTIADILEHGDFGLGTFNHLDGEMVVLDGTVYQLKSDGKAHPVEPDTKTPYACVNFFTPDSEETIDGEFDLPGLTALLERMIPSANMIYAIRIEGEFSYIKTRSVPRQESYRPLVEVAREQPEYEHEGIAGVMTGYWTPTFMASLTVPGYHLHFLSGDRLHGGHLLGCRTAGVCIAIQHLPRLEVGLPVSLDYLTLEFTRDLGADLDEAELDRGFDVKPR